jgi:hypothetical protein
MDNVEREGLEAAPLWCHGVKGVTKANIAMGHGPVGGGMVCNMKRGSRSNIMDNMGGMIG